MYYAGVDPFTKKPVSIAKGMRDRKMQRTLMQFFKPENDFEVRQADSGPTAEGSDRGEEEAGEPVHSR